MKFILLLILITIIWIYVCSAITNTEWYCNQYGLCNRTRDNRTIDNQSYRTQNICRLTCGRFGSLWPSPTEGTLIGKTILNFSPKNLKFDLDNNVAKDDKIIDYLNSISSIFLENIQRECGKNCTKQSNTTVTIAYNVLTTNISLTWYTDESYSLTVDTENNDITVIIDAKTIYGARNGLETYSQLITSSINETGEYFEATDLITVTSCRIKDHPIFTHRGLLLDTSRHFIPMKNIKRTLDGMGASKLNVFHWHITDAQSFPLEIKTIPQMTKYGAYSEQHIYTESNVQDIIEYANYRGIRVIIELDAPAHSGNGWQWGPDYNLGDLAVCVNKEPWRDFCIQPPCGQLNPVNPNTYKVLRNIYKEILNMIATDETLHMGGDELFFNCWNSVPEITSLLIERGHGTNIPDFLQLWSEFQAAVLDIWDKAYNEINQHDVNNIPPKVILWSSQLTAIENIEKYLSKDRYIVQTWVEATDSLAKDLITKGYNVIISTKNAWYFDHGFWGQTSYYNWRKVYSNTIPQYKGVLGGEACVWTEYIDENSLDSRIWPRAAAVAERLWSNPNTSSYLAESRFYRHRERLIVRGIRPDAVIPYWCEKNEGKCS